MFTRSILIPTLIVCVIAAPFLFSNAKQPSASGDPNNTSPENLAPNGSFGNFGAYLPNARTSNPESTSVFRQAGSTTNYQNAPFGNPAFQANARLGGNAVNPALSSNSFTNPALGYPAPSNDWSQTLPRYGEAPMVPGMIPDYGAAQTLVFPGNADGPDLSAPPLEFVPIFNFEEIFRFDIDPRWIQGRWNRVSTSPGINGLHGYRVALVTGTNSWDLHGSLTYFFDQKQSAQRITFRGWTGDPSVVVKLLTQKFDFKSQPTHTAGFYLAKNWGKPIGGLLMKNPTVIYAENPVQQVALVMEINNANGKFSLSEEFQSLVEGSKIVE